MDVKGLLKAVGEDGFLKHVSDAFIVKAKLFHRVKRYEKLWN